MEDIEVPDGGDAGDPVSPDAAELPATEETATPEGEAPADEDGDGQQQEEGDEGAPAEGRGGAYEKLLAKYGGDKNKLADAYFEQANSNSRLWEKLQSIEEYIKGQQQIPQVDEEKLVAEDPNVKEIVKDYNDTHSEIQATTKKQDRLINRYGELENKIAGAEGELRATNDPDVKLEIREKLNDLKSEQKQVRADVSNYERDIKQLNRQLKDLKQRYQDAEARAKESVSRQRQVELERQTAAQATRREFAEAMRTEATRYGIAVGSKQYAVLFQSINDRIYSYLSRLPNGAPGVEIDGAVGALMAEYADTMGLKAKFHRKSDAVRAAAGSAPPRPPVAKGAETVVAPPKDGRWTKASVDERAKRLLGG